MLHTLMPTMAFQDGLPWLVFGSMGGTGQTQTKLQLLTNLIDFRINVQQAIEAPRWVRDGTLVGETITTLRIEDRFTPDTKQDLAARGHELASLGDWSDRTGHAHVIFIDQERQVLHGAANPCSEGIAAGW